MRFERPQFEPTDLRDWTLDHWNSALYRHFFAIESRQSAPPLVRLYVTADALRTACSLTCTAKEARSAFLASIKCALGTRSLSGDAERRAQQWDSESEDVPPFLSHLLLTCMVANDLAEDLRWTGNFRDRL